MNAVVTVESRPPLRYAPTGTSERRRRRTASVNNCSNLSPCSSLLCSSARAKFGDQYLCTVTRSSCKVNQQPGGSSDIPWKRVWEPRVHQ